MACNCSTMRRAQHGDRMDAGDGNCQTFACPFLKFDPTQHAACSHFKLVRVADVRQHLKRKHEDGWGKLKKGGGKKTTHEERWYKLWDALFPGSPRPPTPYADSQGAKPEQRGHEGSSADASGTLMGHVPRDDVQSPGVRPGNASGQGVVGGPSEHQAQATGDGAHQYPLLLAGWLNPIVASAGTMPGPHAGDGGISPTQVSAATMESFAISNLEANSQHFAFSDGHLSAPTHQSPMYQGYDMGLVDCSGAVNSRVDLLDSTNNDGGMCWDWTANHQHGGSS